MTRAHRAKKSLGQNFLIDPQQQLRIVAALEPKPTDTVLEIGPGQGALTRHLVAQVGRLFLVELDNDLAPALAAEFADQPHVTVVHADFMKLDVTTLIPNVSELKVIGNIPYNITTPIIFRLLERGQRPQRIVLMVQKEVAERMVSPPGSGDYGALSVGIRSIAQVERLFHVRRGAFRPVPNVDSTVIRIEPIVPAPLSAEQERDLRELTRATFAWRRKQLQKTLRSAPQYELSGEQITQVQNQLGISLEQRPEQLSPAEFVALARTLRQLQRPRFALQNGDA